MADDGIPLFPLIAITLGVLLSVGLAYYVKLKAKQLFTGFKGLQTKRIIAKFARSTGLEGVADRWQIPAAARGKRGDRNALLSASEDGRLEDVKFLVKRGADVNIESPRTGRSPLMRAAENGHLEVVAFLIQNGARVNAQSKSSGKTALMRAAQLGHPKVVRLLLDNGADVNLKSSATGKTALMRACRCGHHGIAELLLERGARVNTADKTGKTALDYCIEADSKDLAILLSKSGGTSVSHTNSQ
ncbi:MAG: ankyrin repeat domain-containing protein [Desulfomonile tiedjei]|uniref:Ankyrin repeat domain-containing protein n=1 Tax=Desulfomonile tiedjei TaxID=2358 RepID=A0A9D6V7W8_9BACT|nr:ankyrin repeat domain-containing protein [Desulfomonile tiedjei]